jgi:hypothetical protein
MGGHLNLFSRRQKSTKQDKSGTGRTEDRRNSGQAVGKKLIRGMKAVIKLSNRLLTID